MENIVLIGMPASGKSTIGVLAAKALGKGFIDTDLLIQEREGALLQDIITKKGFDRFKEIEEDAVVNLNVRNTVIATGGSVIYSDKAMKHLKQNGIVVYLMASLEEISRRLINISTRGIVFGKCKNLQELYLERQPYYNKYADIIIESDHLGIENTVVQILNRLKYYPDRTQSLE